MVPVNCEPLDRLALTYLRGAPAIIPLNFCGRGFRLETSSEKTGAMAYIWAHRLSDNPNKKLLHKKMFVSCF